MKLKAQVRLILNNKSSYPKCIVTRAEKFDKYNKDSNAAAVKIRKEYRDVWIAFIKRSKKAQERHTVSNVLRARFGEERMKEFYWLRYRIRLRIGFLLFDRHDLNAEIELLEKSDLQDVLTFLEAVNERKANYSWIKFIEPSRFAEIMTWRIINET